ncbi:BglG family transcription antiterminator [Macrococcoides canis]|uniref:BglG family transcription antiterminator n=1 Tax=Macrococcoides canis TaxID=1855823 RepID=UPI0020B6852F|nr:PRD domain-containing protein [Macrococcus canis]UTH00539.1 PRD domain-containing protein [Macrococcus canis]
MLITIKHLQIIKSLLLDTHHEERLAFELGITKRTLSNYCLHIETYFNGSVKVDRSQGLLTLIVIDRISFEAQYERLLQDNAALYEEDKLRSLAIYRYLLSNEICNIDDIAELVFLSKSSTNKIIQSLKKQLSIYDIDIKGITNLGLMLVGEEFNIRRSILELYPEMYDDVSIENTLEDAVNKIISSNNFESSTQDRLRKSIFITNARLREGNTIAHQILIDQQVFQSKWYKLVEDVEIYFNSNYDVENAEKELLLIVLQIIGRRSAVTESLMTLETSEKLINNIINNTIQDIEYFYTIKVNHQLFSPDIKLHISNMINRLIFDINIKNEITININKRYPFAYELSKVLASNIEKELNISVPENELGFLSIYFSVYLEEVERKLKNINKILIISDYGLSTFKLLKSYLIDIFGANIVVDVCAENIDLKKVDDYDLTISTMKLNKLFNKVLYIDDFLNQPLLQSKIEQYLIYKDYNNQKYFNHSILVDQMDKNSFQIINESYSYMELVEKLSDQIVADYNLNDKFKDDILHKETERSTISKFLGFPHTEYNGQEIIIKIALLKHALKENNEVKLVILMAIPKNVDNDTILIRLYEEILAISTNEYFIKKAEGIMDYSSFAILLNQEMRR